VLLIGRLKGCNRFGCGVDRGRFLNSSFGLFLLTSIFAHSLRLMVGERGFEPPTPWSRTNNRCTKLLFRLGLFCVLYRRFA